MISACECPDCLRSRLRGAEAALQHSKQDQEIMFENLTRERAVLAKYQHHEPSATTGAGQMIRVCECPDCLRTRLRGAEIALQQAKDDNQKLVAGLPLSYSKKINCKHSGSWTTYDGEACIACDLHEARTDAEERTQAANDQRTRAEAAEKALAESRKREGEQRLLDAKNYTLILDREKSQAQAALATVRAEGREEGRLAAYREPEEAMVVNAYSAGKAEGASWMLDSIRTSLMDFPDGGGDISVMAEVVRLRNEAAAEGAREERERADRARGYNNEGDRIGGDDCVSGSPDDVPGVEDDIESVRARRSKPWK